MSKCKKCCNDPCKPKECVEHPCYPNSCNECGQWTALDAKPIDRCDEPQYCEDGCLETIDASCVNICGTTLDVVLGRLLDENCQPTASTLGCNTLGGQVSLEICQNQTIDLLANVSEPGIIKFVNGPVFISGSTITPNVPGVYMFENNVYDPCFRTQLITLTVTNATTINRSVTGETICLSTEYGTGYTLQSGPAGNTVSTDCIDFSTQPGGTYTFVGDCGTVILENLIQMFSNENINIFPVTQFNTTDGNVLTQSHLISDPAQYAAFIAELEAYFNTNNYTFANLEVILEPRFWHFSVWLNPEQVVANFVNTIDGEVFLTNQSEHCNYSYINQFNSVFTLYTSVGLLASQNLNGWEFPNDIPQFITEVNTFLANSGFDGSVTVTPGGSLYNISFINSEVTLNGIQTDTSGSADFNIVKGSCN